MLPSLPWPLTVNDLIAITIGLQFGVSAMIYFHVVKISDLVKLRLGSSLFCEHNLWRDGCPVCSKVKGT